MQPSSLSPHPSLPRQPAPPHQHTHSLTNPAGQQSSDFSSYYYNPHYVQAYTQYSSLGNNPPNATGQSTGAGISFSAQTPLLPSVGLANSSRLMSTWYQHGNNRCTHKGCTFAGSRKSVEIHMMDRHLIYPTGWDPKKKKADWDADPSLKGKPIPIQGTTLILNTPEAMEAWISERKKRFPTAARVEERKRKMEEAIARGQLDLTHQRSNKRRKLEPATKDRMVREPRSEKGSRGKCLPPQNTRAPDSGWSGRKHAQGSGLKPQYSTDHLSRSESEGDESDGQPEAIPSKPCPPILLVPEPKSEAQDQRADVLPPPRMSHPNRVHGNAPQPKNPPRNPFASRPTLLRNLLLPEIRMTISNLSQAIRFLVDNDFLQDVELTPGQGAESNKIQVLEQPST